MPWSLTVPSSSTGASPLSEADPEADPDSDPDSRTSAPSSSPQEAMTSVAGNSSTAIFRIDTHTTEGGDRIFRARQDPGAQAQRLFRNARPSVAIASCERASGRQIDAAVAIDSFSAVNDS